MSALNFQRAMAQMVRFPQEPWEKWEAQFGNELTDREKCQLRVMAGDPLVQKFGYKMRFLRQRDSLRVLRVSKFYFDPKMLDTLYLERFETARTSVDVELSGMQFLEFCLTDPGAQKLLDRAEPFFRDLLRYDAARAWAEFTLISDSRGNLPAGSFLCHRAFVILDLDYDIPNLEKTLSADSAATLSPLRRATKVVFLSTEDFPYYRVFKIDQEIADFLTEQRDQPQIGPLPKAYSAMVKVGLCRNVLDNSQSN